MQNYTVLHPHITKMYPGDLVESNLNEGVILITPSGYCFIGSTAYCHATL